MLSPCTVGLPDDRYYFRFYSNQYHIFTKAETNGKKHVEHAVASSLTGPYTFLQTGDFAGWGQIEGPCLTVLPDGKFRLYVHSIIPLL